MLSFYLLHVRKRKKEKKKGKEKRKRKQVLDHCHPNKNSIFDDYFFTFFLSKIFVTSHPVSFLKKIVS